MISYFLKRKGFWSGKVLSRSIFFNFFLKPIVLLDVRFLEKSQYWPEEKIKDLQWSRIKNLISEAYDNVPFWRERFDKAGIRPEDIKNWSDFEKIPIIKKDDLRGLDFESIVNKRIPRRRLYEEYTSGSTGVPFKFVVDRGFIIRSLAFGQRILRALSSKNDFYFLRFRESDRVGFAFGKYFFRISDDDFEARVDDLCKSYGGRNLIIYAVSSHLIRLAKTLSKRKHFINFKAAIASAEALSDIEKRFVAERLGCPVRRCYVSRELSWIAHECEKGYFHVNAEWCRVEIADEAGGVLPEGKIGRVIITAFDNIAMPFIRYDLGDLGEISNDPCVCGRTLPRLKFWGRQSGIIFLKNNKTLHHFSLLGSFHYRSEYIKKFQIIQEAIDRIKIKIVPEKNFSGHLIPLIRQELLSILGDNTNLLIELVADLPSGPGGKRPAFVSFLEQKRL